MKKEEAKKIIDLVNSMIQFEEELKKVEKVADAEAEVKVKVEVKLTEKELDKLFNGKIPEGFDLEKCRAARTKSTGDSVYLLIPEPILEKRWISDPETLERLGYSMTEVENIEDSEISKYKEGLGLRSVKYWGPSKNVI